MMQGNSALKLFFCVFVVCLQRTAIVKIKGKLNSHISMCTSHLKLPNKKNLESKFSKKMAVLAFFSFS